MSSTPMVADILFLLVDYMSVGQTFRLLSCCKYLWYTDDLIVRACLLKKIGLAPSKLVSLPDLSVRIVKTKRCRECGARTDSLVRSPKCYTERFPLCACCSKDSKGYRRLVTRIDVQKAKRESSSEHRGRRRFPITLIQHAKVSQNGAFLYWPSAFPDLLFKTA